MSDSPTVSLSADELKDRFLVCNVCFEEYDDDRKHPRLLPCLHTYCYHCLHQLIRQDIVECPECRKPHQLNNKSIEDAFSKDNTRRDLMDFVQVQKSIDNIWCSACTSKVKSNFRCKQCAEFLCNVCSDAHRRTTKTRGHTIIPLAEIKQTQNFEAFCNPQMCPNHPSNALELYCAKSTCLKPICCVCAFVSCKESNGHIILSIDEVAQSQRHAIEEKIGLVCNKKNEIKDTRRIIQSEVREIEESKSALESEVDKTFDEMIEDLQKRRKQLKLKLANQVNSKTKILHDQEGQLKVREQHIEECVGFCEQALSYTNSPALLQIDNTINGRLDELLLEPFDFEPHEKAFLGFRKTSARSELQRVMSSMAITASPIYPLYTEVKSGQEAKQNQPIEFSVELFDFTRHSVTEESVLSGNIEVYVEDTMDRKIVLYIDQDSLDLGRIQLQFVPLLSGKHTLVVSVIEKDIHRHDFYVKEQKPTKSHVSRITRKDAERLLFPFDQERVHAEVSTSPNGKTFQNLPYRKSQVTSQQFRNYKGTIGNIEFKKPKSYYYEVEVRFWIRKPLETSNLVFEIGIARRQSVDQTRHVEGQPNAWSIIATQHADCNAICLHVAHNDQCLFHQKLSENEKNCVMKKTFGMLIDMRRGHWGVYDCADGSNLFTIKDMDVREPLSPVVAGYNPSQVAVAMTLID